MPKLASLIAVLFLFLPMPPKITRIMMIGNSITFRTPAMAEIGWNGMWGVAATQADRDWPHRLQLMVTARQGSIPDIRIVSVTTPEIPAEVTKQILAYAPDVVIVQWGEVMPWNASAESWREQYQPLGEAAQAVGARAIAVGVWGNEPGDPRNERIRNAALAATMTFVQISDLHTMETEATADGVCTNTSVCWHPGDRGMALIAGRILAAIYSESTFLPLVVGGDGTIPPGR